MSATRTFTRVDDGIVDLGLVASMTRAELAVYLVLARHAQRAHGDGAYCVSLSIPKIGKLAGVASDRNTRDAVARLLEIGVMEVVEASRGSRPRVLRLVAPGREQPGDEGSPGRQQPVAHDHESPLPVVSNRLPATTSESSRSSATTSTGRQRPGAVACKEERKEEEEKRDDDDVGARCAPGHEPEPEHAGGDDGDAEAVVTELVERLGFSGSLASRWAAELVAGVHPGPAREPGESAVAWALRRVVDCADAIAFAETQPKGVRSRVGFARTWLSTGDEVPPEVREKRELDARAAKFHAEQAEREREEAQARAEAEADVETRWESVHAWVEGASNADLARAVEALREVGGGFAFSSLRRQRLTRIERIESGEIAHVVRARLRGGGLTSAALFEVLTGWGVLSAPGLGAA